MKNIYIFIVLGVIAIGVLGFFMLRSPIEAPNVPMSSNQENEVLPSDSSGLVAGTILMKNEGYMPNRITIKAGEAVEFVNQASDARWPASNIHPTHEIYPEFDPKRPIAPGESWVFIFEKAGEWRMHDHLFPQFTGVITVE